MKKNMLNKLWVEKYRPESLSDVIFQNEQFKHFFENVITSKDIPNLLLCGAQGTGKTTLSHVLINEVGIDKTDILKIKCSDETGVDAMRDKISRFAETMPVGDIKIVQLEECDFLSTAAQAVLRHIVEDNSDNCRFIFTCNYANKLMPALKSRLQVFEFKAPSQEDVLVRMVEILDKEQVEIDLDALEKTVSICYPDIRKTIQTLYQNSRTGKLVLPISSNDSADWKFELLNKIEANNFVEARKLVCENVSRDEFEDLYYWLYKNIQRAPKFKDQSKLEQAIVVISDYEYKSSFMAHLDINAAAMFITLGNL